MVNSIDVNSAINQAYPTGMAKIPQTVTKAGTQIAEQLPDSFSSTLKSGVNGTLIWNGFPLVRFIKNLRKNPVISTAEGLKFDTKQVLQNMDKSVLDSFKNIFKGKEGTVIKRAADFLKQSENNQRNYTNLKEVLSTAKDAAKKMPKAKTSEEVNLLKKNISKSIEKFNNPDKFVLEEAKQEVAKLTEQAAQNPGVRKIQKALKKATKNLNKIEKGAQNTSKFSKFMKNSGAKGMLIISGIGELLTEVGPTFKQLGVKKGIKQTAKSAVKVVGDTFGFVAGSQAGTAAGTLAGAFVSAKISALTGTAVAPGIGTVIGGLCGFVGGLLGSWALRKITSPFTKSELEIAKQQQETVENNPFTEFEQYQTDPSLA